MSDNKTYRIKANVGQDSMLNVNLNQDYKTFEILSLKIDSDNLYKFHTSDYGCVAGRVLANGNFGIPNAKISIFIKATDEDLSDAILSYLYPYKNTRIKNEDGVRYNLLPDEQLSDCHRNVGTFPNKRLVLDDNNVFEVYDKYYKYTTRTNNSGDYMIFGVPVGEQTIHVDIDLSDIGILSQRPRDMIYKGYNATQFENANMFKKSTDLDTLTQIISQNSNVYVYPFWGETSEGDVAITRKDIEIQYVFEPTCVFMGSIITDEKSNAISKNCVPSERMGKMDRLTTGSGTIEMIRKKPDGSVEEFIVQGNQLIDGNGVWCYQIPMNLDYVCTDEYGNIVPTDDPKKGIPTRTRVRFRMSITENEDGAQFSHAAKTLVPNNPQTNEDLDYVFGSKTLDDEFATKSFRDLFWNKVYSVKSYIPRFQQGNYNRNKRFSGIKEVNVNGANNPLPYNNMRVDISFMFSLQCAIFHILLKLVTFFNYILGILYGINEKYSSFGKEFRLDLGDEMNKGQTPCVFLGDGYCPDLKGWYFAPGCKKEGLYKSTFSQIQKDQGNSNDTESIEYENGEDEKICLTRNIQYFTQCTEINMAMEYDVIQFDFYNDWVNGVIYSPRWNADMRKKRSYLFGLIRVSPRLNACSEENFSSTRRLVQQCAMQYGYDTSVSGFTANKTSNGCVDGKNKQRCHKGKGRKWVKIFGYNGGVVHREITMDSSAYYYKPFEWRKEIKHPLFATDIILLGSLNENDEQGIPQTFTKLLSSTYQLPDALASTNIGAEGFLYGYSGGGALCNKSIKDEGVIIHKVEGDFSGLVKWSKGSEEYEVNPYDDSKPITETSGIDWGFSGPEQGENNFNSLYYPGGHFLGISCTWSEVNIKSCVNLSRICELGSTISHRKSFMVREGEDSYRYIDSVPSGLISGDELLDYSGKNEFATLNYNGLITRHNKENNLLEYDFKTIIPINFNGELKEKVSGKAEYGKTIDDNTFIRTIEETNRDYYRFRMGFNGTETTEEQKTHFLISSGENVAMPVYKNSFYFYFGLSNGNTALDKFNKEFFAECPKLNAYTPEVVITTDSAEVCSFNSNGQFKGAINIFTKSVDNPRFKVTSSIYNVNNGILYNNVKHSFDAYTDVVYDITVYGDNIIGVNKKVTLDVEMPERLSDVRCNVKDFEKGIIYDDFASECDTSKTGYVTITIPHDENVRENAVSVIIATGRKYHYVLGDSSYGLPNEISSYTSVNYGSISGSLSKCYLWEGNTDYDVYVRVFCGTVGTERMISPWFKCTNFYVNMPDISDVIFHGNSDASYQKVLKKYPRGYVNNLLDDSTIAEDVRNSFKQAIYFRESKYDAYTMESLDIEVRTPANIEPTYFISRDTVDNAGGETFLTYSKGIKGDYSDLQGVYVPNKLLPRQTGYGGYLYDIDIKDYESLLLDRKIGIYGGSNRLITFYDSPYYDGYTIERSGSGKEINTKKEYLIDLDGRPIDDLDWAFLTGAIVSFDVPYLPFLFKALFIIDNENIITSTNSSYTNISIANGIKKRVGRHYEYKTIDVCGFSLKNVLSTENIDYSALTGESFSTYENSFCIEDMYPIDSANLAISFPSVGRGEYSVKIEEYDGRTLSESVIVRFIGDKYGDGPNDYYSYEEGEGKIMYHKISKSMMSGIRFTSYFLRDLGGRYNKKLISNKGKYFTADFGNSTITSPFFPGWDIGTLGMLPTSQQYVKDKGGDYNQAMLWPKYGSGYSMWSSWYFCHGDTELYEEVLRAGDISGSDDEFVIIGVYDELYNGHETLENGRGLFGDPMASRITIVKVYSVSNFNELKRKIGLTR